MKVLLAWITLGLLICGLPGRAAQTNASAHEEEQKLIAVLKSDAPAGDKAIACKRLAIYGSSEAVPALAALLSNPELSSWARIGLEAIPGPAADEALRQAMDQVKGPQLVGVINSIGVRRDAKANKGLAMKLKDTDSGVASAAAVALGRIGGVAASKTLLSSLKTAAEPVRPAVAEGAILCAERFLAQGQASKAIKVYDTVRASNIPKQKQLEGTRGAILARQAKGLPLLIEQLHSPDKDSFGIGLRTARELPGTNITAALALELHHLAPQRQPMLLLALADRRDAAALPAVLEAARIGNHNLRVAALRVVEHFDTVASIPVLLQGATDAEPDIARAAIGSLQRLSAKDVDADLAGRLANSSGKMRQVLLELCALRGMSGSLPAIVACTRDTDADVRRAALNTLSLIGEEHEVGELVALLGNPANAADRDQVGKALVAICSRRGAACLPPVLPLAKSGQSESRLIALDALASIGGADALSAVAAAVEDPVDTVQEQAVRLLSAWPNTWPEDGAVAQPLLAIARHGGKVSFQVLAVRGYLQHVQGDKKLTDAEKVARLNELLPLIQRPEEKRSAITLLERIPNEEALQLLVQLAADPGVVGEACSAIVSSATRANYPVAKEQREKALQAVLEKSADQSIRQKADAALKKL